MLTSHYYLDTFRNTKLNKLFILSTCHMLNCYVIQILCDFVYVGQTLLPKIKKQHKQTRTIVPD